MFLCSIVGEERCFCSPDTESSLYKGWFLNNVLILSHFLRTKDKWSRNISELSPISFLFQVDNTLPGFAYDYVKGVLKKAEIHDKFDLCETLLRLGGSQDCEGKACNLYVNTIVYMFVFWHVENFPKMNQLSELFNLHK